METTPISKYFGFGLNFWYLRRVEAGFRIHNRSDIPLDFVLSAIDSFFTHLDQLNLQVTSNASRELVLFRNSIENTDKEAVLDKAQADRLEKIMMGLETTLVAELESLDVYVVTPKRLDTVKLLARPFLLFAPRVFERLPTVAQYDFSEAGKCIAFERPTAAAFHLMRSTEAVLREYYCFHVRRNRISPLLWGAITKDLQAKRLFQKDEKHSVLLKNLDNIRLSFRNPTQHPDKIYDIQEAQDLFGLCVDAINRMASELPITS